ncbi:flagellar basal body L-ring protein FlgH [Inmirania thermothiophila]|uniref:Flagellar L-ring protein n=1 Tax=Inmirania thermothiophila TaxID=1750597 RepID=A0A3N1YB82_9GAMM|nr:flagellar basal body L-ring protein FlgH [Inmirania thermothiophila]ROR34912.1 flagellar L-ring protein precursor FlgH [Inmirania thermothiophila]
MRPSPRPAAVAAAALLLGACAATPPLHDPAFAPVPPPAPQPAARTAGAVYQEGFGLALFADRRARRVGDILTIVLVESTEASKKAETTTSREASIDATGPTLLGDKVIRHGREILSASVDATQENTGSGTAEQSNSLEGRITVTVAEVLPNGYLRVRGEKVLTLGRGDEFVRFSGIVRPEDIRADNTVPSTQVADARIVYSGRGEVADAAGAGWLSRFFLRVWPF